MLNSKKMLKYALYRNHLTEGENDFSAIPLSLTNKKIEDIIAQITKPGSILKQTECVAVIHDFFRAISENLVEGTGFISEYIRIQPRISGVFEGQDDQFDEQRHQKQISVSAAGVLRGAISRLKVEKVLPNVRTPMIESVYDLKTQSYDNTLSPGHMIEIRGSRLKVHMEQPDEGIFLINDADGAATRLDHVHGNLPSTLSAMLPEGLAAGDYTVEVRTRLSGNSSLFTGVFAKTLIIN
jgi:hypothetical protein